LNKDKACQHLEQILLVRLAWKDKERTFEKLSQSYNLHTHTNAPHVILWSTFKWPSFTCCIYFDYPQIDCKNGSLWTADHCHA